MRGNDEKSIKEIIVVEGRDDISAVKAAVDAEIIQVNGFAVRKQGTIRKIRVANQNKGIINSYWSRSCWRGNQKIYT